MSISNSKSWNKASRIFQYSYWLGLFTEFNLDGKVLWATAKAGPKKSGICIVSAWVAHSSQW
jgi:hypothetical protein